jgi:2-haloacid dehalogenase
MTRREFIGALAPVSITRAAMSTKAVIFDAFPILDPRPVWQLAADLFPSKGAELANLWRIKQFEYAWLRTLSNNYADFWQVTGDALVFAAKSLQLELAQEKRSLLMNAWLRLKCWPDVPDALRTLKSRGLRLAFLSNLTPKMLDSGIRNSGLEGMFDAVLSTDRVRSYKPDPRAYRMALESLHLRPQEITFVAFAGWDAAGARTFGYDTFWVNRQNQPAEELGAAADGAGSTMADLVTHLTVSK